MQNLEAQGAILDKKTCSNEQVTYYKREEVIAAIDQLIDNKWFGGIELKVENGKIDYLKNWRGRKY